MACVAPSSRVHQWPPMTCLVEHSVIRRCYRSDEPAYAGRSLSGGADFAEAPRVLGKRYARKAQGIGFTAGWPRCQMSGGGEAFPEPFPGGNANFGRARKLLSANVKLASPIGDARVYHWSCAIARRSIWSKLPASTCCGFREFRICVRWSCVVNRRRADFPAKSYR